MKIYRVGIKFQCYDCYPEIAVKYFANKHEADEYLVNLEKFTVRAIRIYKKLNESIERLEKLVDAGKSKLDIDKVYHRRYNAILNGQADYFMNYEAHIFKEEAFISDNTNVNL
ncbi:MAG: hypothetical protein EGP82_00095 [Odoribacter splanchnicus]|nr:hypothetical protein [Odoribacter splanchnicus]